MNNTTPPAEEQTSTVRKLYFFAVIMVLIAISAALLIIFLPDNKPQVKKDSLRLTFEKQGTGVVTAPDGKIRTSFDLEFAETPEEQKTGLMYRESMADKQGMLFINQAPERLNFWMKNTYLPLDLVFILPDSTIYKVVPDNQPFSESGISADRDCQYVLEINAGLAKAWGMIPGDKISWTRIKN